MGAQYLIRPWLNRESTHLDFYKNLWESELQRTPVKQAFFVAKNRITKWLKWLFYFEL